jgi:hypothetical protein
MSGYSAPARRQIINSLTLLFGLEKEDLEQIIWANIKTRDVERKIKLDISNQTRSKEEILDVFKKVQLTGKYSKVINGQTLLEYLESRKVLKKDEDGQYIFNYTEANAKYTFERT